LVAHSLGGIVVKDAIVLAKDHLEHKETLFPSVKGVLFLGTPHHGSNAASLGKIAFEASRILLQKPNLKILRSLESNSDILERVSKSFSSMIQNNSHIRLHSFLEELPYHGVMIVPASSASMGLSNETRGFLYANHRTMARFGSISDVNFQRVTSIITQWLDKIIDNSKFKLDLNLRTEYDSCLKSLNVSEAHLRQQQVENVYPGTYSWIVETQADLVHFLAGEKRSPVFWIQGIPGSGKSTAMKYAFTHELVQKSLHRSDPNPWVLSSFFFHDRGSFNQKSLGSFLRESLFQIPRSKEGSISFHLPIVYKFPAL
jgi:hypothetical protein